MEMFESEMSIETIYLREQLSTSFWRSRENTKCQQTARLDLSVLSVFTSGNEGFFDEPTLKVGNENVTLFLMKIYSRISLCTEKKKQQ